MISIRRAGLRVFTTASLVTMLALVAGNVSTAEARFGIAGMYHEDLDFGIQGRFQTAAAKKLTIVPQFGYFFDPEVWDANIDLHLDFKGSGKLNFYGLGGLNMVADSDFDNTEFGGNLGGGFGTLLGDSARSVFFEAKYIFSDAEGFGLNFGIMF